MSTTIERAPLSRRIHVLEVVGNAIVGGVETYVLRLLQYMPAQRFRFTAVCPFEGVFADRLREAGAEVFVIPLPADMHWQSLVSLCALVNTRGVDVIQSHMSNAHIASALAGQLTGTPVLHMAHGRLLASEDVEAHRLAGSHLAAVCSSSYLHLLGMGVAPERAHLIPNGVDLERFQPRRERDGALRQRFGIAPEAPLVGFVGRLDHDKGPDVFVHAMALLHHMVPEAHAVLVGDGPLRKRAAELIEQMGLQGCTHLAGVQPDPAAVMAELDVLVSTSRTEAMPLVVMEAMAAGLPVVATSVGGVPELIQHQRSGYLCTEGDVHGVAASVRTLVRDRAQWQAYAAAGRERAERDFSLDRCVERNAALLAQLAAQSARRSTAEGAAQGARAAAAAAGEATPPSPALVIGKGHRGSGGARGNGSAAAKG
jgi:glycosyltransferase involved in cell wall biosynthesis